ncbi:MAG: chromosomal replication initiator protein DnaA [Ktedonobacteraceae bacterium]|nr:chromosomal replication initiator protein DnaA [Ktedonobacteraceae bacterium]
MWQTTIERLQSKVTPAVFTTWFQGTSALSFQDSIFTVGVPTTFAKAHLENRFLDVIRSLLVEVIGKPVEVQFVVSKEKANGRTERADETGDTAGISADPAMSRRSGRQTRRASAVQHARRIAEVAAESVAAMHSLLPVPPLTNARLAPPNVQNQQKQQAQQEELSAPSPEPQSGTDYTLFSSGSPVSTPGQSMLNPRYTFSTFIVGKTNELAHAASLAVSERPGHIYNPLFLYGGVGLGKTHLLHAVGHVGEANGLNVLYVTSEKFTNEIINAIRYQKTEEFRAKYRQIDILLIDDIQFIAGKDSTEEEFFHTFNTLHNANKQIVVTSDRPPRAILSLQDRLRSRFEWGLLADVQPPEYEHRLAILRSKCDSLRFTVPPAVIEYIARPICSSVRELEGALNRVIAYATLHNAPLTVGLAAEALEHIYNDRKPSSNLTPADILAGVCRYYNIDSQLIRGKQRDRDIVWPRQVAMYLMREETDASLLQIGAELGGRDHTTIMHGWEKVHTEVTHNDRARQEVAAVLASIQQNI